MVRGGPGAAGAIAALLAGAVACSVAAPAPPPGKPSATADAATSVTAQPSVSPAPSSATPSRDAAARRGSLILEVEALDPAWTAPLLEFASDGEAVIFSSGRVDGPDAAGAPDLWRYQPGADAPELLWRNPRRDRSLVRIGGDRDTWAFVDIGLDGARAWDLWLLTEPGGEPMLLDTHPGDEDVSSLVPSFVVHEGQIAWTAFDQGPAGPVSQLLLAQAPDWEPRLIAERPAREAELWLPSLRGSLLAYCEVLYSPDRSTDERHVYLLDLADPDAQPIRLDTSGLATMPLLVDDGVVWKETDPGFSMFNWGRLIWFDLRSGEAAPLSTRPQEYVNYPSAGLRFVAAWGADAFTFTIHDLDLEMSRFLERYEPETHQSVLRPHVAGDLLVWLYTTQGGPPDGAPTHLRYALLPGAGTDRDR